VFLQFQSVIGSEDDAMSDGRRLASAK